MIKRRKLAAQLIVVLFMITSCMAPMSANVMAEAHPDQQILAKLMPIAGGALVDAGQHKWQDAENELAAFEQVWKTLNPGSSKLAQAVATAIANVKKALPDAEDKPDEAFQTFRLLTRATNAYVNDQSVEEVKSDGKQEAASMQPLLLQITDDANNGDWLAAQQKFKQFLTRWKKSEGAIRGGNAQAYGSIETKITLARISLQADPPDSEAAKTNVAALVQAVSDFVSGTISAADPQQTAETSISSLIDLLDEAAGSLDQEAIDPAIDALQRFITQWPLVEGEVMSRSAKVYADIENGMALASSQLVSNPPQTVKAQQIIAEMRSRLVPFLDRAAYTIWDAAVILLREGVEALLIIAALLAFLHQTGNSSKRSWIWSGAGAGLLLSGVLAVILTYAISNLAAGSSREAIEGITGIVSVLLMIAVSLWLHGKTRAQAWNEYIKAQIGKALGEGKLWYLFIIAGLAILREGAETTIFYIGMAPVMEPLELAAGIGLAALILILLGFAVIKGSFRLPVRPFFIMASLFIYYVIFKVLGQSIHSLQVADKLATTPHESLLSAAWLGIYPTWETTVPQAAALLFIAIQLLRLTRNHKG